MDRTEKQTTIEKLLIERGLDKNQELRFTGFIDKKMQAEITAAHHEAINKLRLLYRKKGFAIEEKLLEFCSHRVTVQLNPRMRSCGGRAYGMLQMIQINYKLHKENPEQLIPTYLHELAHLINFHFNPRNRSHGRQWQSIMRQMDQSPDRTHNMDTKKLKHKRRKFRYECQCMIHEIGITRHRRIQSGNSNYTCKRCKSRLTIH